MRGLKGKRTIPLVSDPLHGAVNALEAVTKKEAKPLQNAEPQSGIAEHQGPDFGSIEKDGFRRLLA